MRYTYDYENRLTVVTYPDDSRTTFSYNGEGKRVQVQEGAGSIKYLYDLDKVILERNGAGNLLARYTHEGGSLYHDLVSMKRGGASYYFLFDGLGSVTEVVDSSENTQNSYRYEAWGQVQSSTENVTNPYRYIGAYGVHWDPSPALYFMQARYYEASVGRFMSMERRIGSPQHPSSLHKYLYVENNPVERTDARGTTPRAASALRRPWWWWLWPPHWFMRHPPSCEPGSPQPPRPLPPCSFAPGLQPCHYVWFCVPPPGEDPRWSGSKWHGACEDCCALLYPTRVLDCVSDNCDKGVPPPFNPIIPLPEPRL